MANEAQSNPCWEEFLQVNAHLRDIAGFAPQTFAWLLGLALVSIQGVAYALTIGVLP